MDFDKAIQVLKTKQSYGYRVTREDVTRVATQVADEFLNGNLDGNVAHDYQMQLFELWPDK